MLEQWYYLLALGVSLAGLMVIDWRYTLALWHDARRTLLTIGSGVGIFIIWDMLGIMFGIFMHGGGVYALPFRLAPEFPVEEIFFLTLLCYVTLILFRFGEAVWPRTSY